MVIHSEAISAERCVVRNTGGRSGRTISVAPGRTASKHLHYGRIILDRATAPLRFDTNELETGFVCLKGAAAITVEGRTVDLHRYDALYACLVIRRSKSSGHLPATAATWPRSPRP